MPGVQGLVEEITELEREGRGAVVKEVEAGTWLATAPNVTPEPPLRGRDWAKLPVDNEVAEKEPAEESELGLPAAKEKLELPPEVTDTLAAAVAVVTGGLLPQDWQWTTAPGSVDTHIFWSGHHATPSSEQHPLASLVQLLVVVATLPPRAHEHMSQPLSSFATPFVQNITQVICGHPAGCDDATCAEAPVRNKNAVSFISLFNQSS